MTRTILFVVLALSATSPAAQDASVRADPDAVVHGRATRIVITGRDITLLESLGVRGEGVRVEPVQLMTPPAGGVAMAFTVTVDANAAPGPRRLTVVDPSSATVTVKTSPNLSPEERAKLQQRISEAQTVDAGTIHINTHELAVTELTFSGGGRMRTFRMAVIDEVER